MTDDTRAVSFVADEPTEPFTWVNENLSTQHGFVTAGDLLRAHRELVDYGLSDEEAREVLGLGVPHVEESE